VADHPIRLRLVREGTDVVLKALIAHEMESGFRKDEQGVLIPEWYIEEVRVFLDEQEVGVSYWGPAVSKNPFLELCLKDVAQGSSIALTWLDSRGESGRQQALVKV
jgi:thiosulfate oxidation carrier complex protein SoxZ